MLMKVSIKDIYKNPHTIAKDNVSDRILFVLPIFKLPRIASIILNVLNHKMDNIVSLYKYRRRHFFAVGTPFIYDKVEKQAVVKTANTMIARIPFTFSMAS